jgi:hypothetical protein
VHSSGIGLGADVRIPQRKHSQFGVRMLEVPRYEAHNALTELNKEYSFQSLEYREYGRRDSSR